MPLPARLSAPMDAVDRLLPATRRVWRSYMPSTVRDRVNRLRAIRRETVSRKPKDLGGLRRTTPFTTWGAERGGSIPRAYIAEFLGQHEADIHGRVLEIASDRYASLFGARVDQVDILDVHEDNEHATFIADLADAPSVPDNTYDCVIVTQVLSWIYDVRAGFRTAHRILAPDGVMLATTPGLARQAPVEKKLFGEWWHFTAMSATRVAEETFGKGNVEVQTYGNVLAAAASLFGLGQDDLAPEELAIHDPAFEVVVAIRAVKRA
jgi:SAM-dependent methyltransferase